ARYFVPPIGHFVPQAQAQGEIRPQLHFILEIPGCFGRPVSQRDRIPDHVKLARDILEKCQHARIADASCRKLRVPNMVFVYPLRPNASAERMLASGEAEIVCQAEEFPDVAKGIDTRRWRDG